MMIMEKSRFGFNMMVFVVLLSLVGLLPYDAGAIDVSDATYEPLKVLRSMEKTLDDEIKKAIVGNQYFYVGVAKQYGVPGTAIQSLCERQRGVVVKGSYPARCSRSSHRQDEKAADKYGAKLEKVYYIDTVTHDSAVCATEKKLIAKYKGKTPFCLNVEDGNDVCCIRSKTGIVYLRIYK